MDFSTSWSRPSARGGFLICCANLTAARLFQTRCTGRFNSAEIQARPAVDYSAPESGAAQPAASDQAATQQAPRQAESPPPGRPVPDPAPATDVAPSHYTEELWTNALSIDYRGERLTAIHALDVKNHLTARYSIAATMASFDERYLATLLEGCDTTPKVADRAFILFTEKGRHYIYLDQSTPPELNTIWETVYSKGAPKNIHWLTHMTTSKIVRIRFNGWNRAVDTAIGLDVQDSETIAKIADFLKHCLNVNPNERLEVFGGTDNPVMVAGLYDMSIEFDNGVRYRLMGYGDYGGTDEGGSGISIHTSDLDKSVHYTLNEGAAGHLRNFMEEQQIAYWRKNGDPTRMNIDILSAWHKDDKLIYSRDLKVPVRITNDSERAVTVTTGFVTQRHRLGGNNWEYIAFGEGHFGDVSVEIPAKGNAEIEIPFSVFDITDDGKGKYQTDFWVNVNFKEVARYVLE